MAARPLRFGPYEVLGELGQGGMGAVYLARDPGLNREVAIKTLTAERAGSPAAWERLVREAQAAARLRHPNLVQVHALEADARPPYMVMELIRGRTMAELLRSTPQERLLRWLAEAAEGVQFAHEQGVLHRDLKPENVLVEDGTGRAVVTDFGLARELEEEGDAAERLTRSGVSIGTVTHMSPEQATGNRAAQGPGSDVWALGVMLYRILTGTLPFSGQSVDVLLQIVRAEPEPPSRRVRAGVAPGLEALCLRALQRAPEARPGAGDFAAALRRELDRAQAATRDGLSQVPVHAAPTLGSDDGALAAPAPRRSRAVLAGALIGGLMALAAAIVELGRRATMPAAPSIAEVPSAQPGAPAPPVDDASELLAKAHEALRKADGELALEITGALLARPPAAVHAEALLVRAQVRLLSDEYRLALPDLERVPAATRDEGAWDFAQGLSAYAQGDWERAQRSLDRAQRLRPTDAEVALWSGLTCRARGDLDRALALYDYALQLHPTFLAALSFRALGRQDRRDFQGAFDDCTRLLAVKERNAKVWRLRGNVRQAMGDHLGALQDLGRALELDPDLPGLTVDRAVSRMNLRDFMGAVEDYTRAIERDPLSRNGRGGRGLARRELGDLAGALTDFTRAIELDPGRSAGWYQRGLVKADMGDLMGALQDLDRAVELDPKEPVARDNRGAIRRRMGDVRGAYLDHTRAIELAPLTVRSRRERALLLQDVMNDLDGALADWDAVLALDPRNVEAHYNRGVIHQRLDLAQEALRDFSRTLELDPGHANALCRRGLVRRNLADLDGAIADLSRAIELDPRHALALSTRGELRLRLGDRPGAIADLELALELFPAERSERDRAQRFLNEARAPSPAR